MHFNRIHFSPTLDGRDYLKGHPTAEAISFSHSILPETRGATSNATDAENMASVAATSPSFVLLLAAPPKTLSLVTSKPILSPPPPPPPPPLRPSHSQWRRSGRSASRKSAHLWRTRAASGAETTIEKAQQVIPAASDDGSVSTIVSALLFSAFIGLSVLTIGVIYLAVQDFLQKREREKFEKQEAENNKKKGGKKGKVKARAGPRGFGQKIEEEEE